MSIDLNKYKFITHNRKDGRVEIIALATFAGKMVRGKAICSLDDTFDREKGMKLAAARCNEKIACKRYALSKKKLREAEDAVLVATRRYDQMRHYQEDSFLAKINASKLVKDMISEL